MYFGQSPTASSRTKHPLLTARVSQKFGSGVRTRTYAPLVNRQLIILRASNLTIQNEARRLFPGPRRRRPRDLTQQTGVPLSWMLRMTEEVKKKFFDRLLVGCP